MNDNQQNEYPLHVQKDEIDQLLKKFKPLEQSPMICFLAWIESLVYQAIIHEIKLEKNQEAMGGPLQEGEDYRLVYPLAALFAATHAILFASGELTNFNAPILCVELKKHRQIAVISNLVYGDNKQLTLSAKTSILKDDPEITLQTGASGGEGYMVMKIQKEEIQPDYSLLVYCALIANMMLQATKLQKSTIS